MAEKVLDYKKEYKELYLPKEKPVLIVVPPMNFIMVDGKGDPNHNQDYEQAVELLYGLSYAIKMSKKKGLEPEGYFEYVVPPLEGLWTVSDGHFSLEQRNNWVWMAMIRQPEFVNSMTLEWAKEELHKKKPGLPVEKARLETYDEGLSVQALHLGPYATETETMSRMQALMQEKGLADLVVQGRKHHEIYLSDPRKSRPESMKTVLRHPVARIR